MKLDKAFQAFRNEKNDDNRGIFLSIQKEKHQALNSFESGYFTIEGDNRKFSTCQMPFHYYFAKGRMSFDDMLEWASDLYIHLDKISA